MTPPTELLFDIETLINAAQPRRILLVGNIDAAFLDDYCQQKAILNQPCEVMQVHLDDVDQLWQLESRYDVGIVLNLFEHLDRSLGHRVLSRLRDVLTAQYCIALPLQHQSAESSWQLTDLFAFALNKVNEYDSTDKRLTLFKYNIQDYKKTPDWLNADNWANPQLWGKYWW